MEIESRDTESDVDAEGRAISDIDYEIVFNEYELKYIALKKIFAEESGFFEKMYPKDPIDPNKGISNEQFDRFYSEVDRFWNQGIKDKKGVMYKLNGKQRKDLKDMFLREKEKVIYPTRLRTFDGVKHKDYMEELYQRFYGQAVEPVFELSIKMEGFGDPPHITISQ